MKGELNLSNYPSTEIFINMAHMAETVNNDRVSELLDDWLNGTNSCTGAIAGAMVELSMSDVLHAAALAEHLGDHVQVARDQLFNMRIPAWDGKYDLVGSLANYYLNPVMYDCYAIAHMDFNQLEVRVERIASYLLAMMSRLMLFGANIMQGPPPCACPDCDIEVYPDHGSPGTIINFTGYGFEPNEEVVISYGGAAFHESTRANAEGELNHYCCVPDLLKGSYDLRVGDQELYFEVT